MVKFGGLKEEAQRNFTVSSSYEGRFYTSITVACAASLTAIISFSNNYEIKEQFFNSMVLSFWCLFAGILCSGCLPFILSLQHKSLGDTAINLANLDLFMSKVEKQLISEESEIYKNVKSKFEASDRKCVFWKRIKIFLALVSIVFLIVGLIIPLYKITTTGDLI